MHKKDYVKAANIVREMRKEALKAGEQHGDTERFYREKFSTAVTNAFVKLFDGDNPRFDKEKFISACNEES